MPGRRREDYGPGRQERTDSEGPEVAPCGSRGDPAADGGFKINFDLVWAIRRGQKNFTDDGGSTRTSGFETSGGWKGEIGSPMDVNVMRSKTMIGDDPARTVRYRNKNDTDGRTETRTSGNGHSDGRKARIGPAMVTNVVRSKRMDGDFLTRTAKEGRSGVGDDLEWTNATGKVAGNGRRNEIGAMLGNVGLTEEMAVEDSVRTARGCNTNVPDRKGSNRTTGKIGFHSKKVEIGTVMGDNSVRSEFNFGDDSVQTECETTAKGSDGKSSLRMTQKSSSDNQNGMIKMETRNHDSPSMKRTGVQTGSEANASGLGSRTTRSADGNIELEVEMSDSSHHRKLVDVKEWLLQCQLNYEEALQKQQRRMKRIWDLEEKVKGAGKNRAKVLDEIAKLESSMLEGEEELDSSLELVWQATAEKKRLEEGLSKGGSQNSVEVKKDSGVEPLMESEISKVSLPSYHSEEKIKYEAVKATLHVENVYEGVVMSTVERDGAIRLGSPLVATPWIATFQEWKVSKTLPIPLKREDSAGDTGITNVGWDGSWKMLMEGPQYELGNKESMKGTNRKGFSDLGSLVKIEHQGTVIRFVGKKGKLGVDGGYSLPLVDKMVKQLVFGLMGLLIDDMMLGFFYWEGDLVFFSWKMMNDEHKLWNLIGNDGMGGTLVMKGRCEKRIQKTKGSYKLRKVKEECRENMVWMVYMNLNKGESVWDYGEKHLADVRDSHRVWDSGG